jgi:hypothetical protein
MRSRPGTRSLIFGAALFAAGLAVGAVLASRASAPARADVREGATLASYLPDAVMSLTYATSDGMTTVQRSTPGAPFEILATFANGKPTQRCRASADMNGHLNGLTELSARRSLSLERREQEFPLQLGVIDVRDTVIGEPFGPMLAFTNKNRTAVAIVVDRHAAEVTLRAAELDWLKTACSGSSG